MKMNKLGQGVLSPKMIMSIVVTLIIMAVGVYAFFTVQNEIPVTAPNNASGVWTTTRENSSYYAVQNVSGIGSQVFNVVGVVMVIGAIMLIVTMVYSYMRP